MLLSYENNEIYYNTIKSKFILFYQQQQKVYDIIQSGSKIYIFIMQAKFRPNKVEFSRVKAGEFQSSLAESSADSYCDFKLPATRPSARPLRALDPKLATLTHCRTAI